jgi:hypothetical protein
MEVARLASRPNWRAPRSVLIETDRNPLPSRTLRTDRRRSAVSAAVIDVKKSRLSVHQFTSDPFTPMNQECLNLAG